MTKSKGSIVKVGPNKVSKANQLAVRQRNPYEVVREAARRSRSLPQRTPQYIDMGNGVTYESY